MLSSCLIANDHNIVIINNAAAKKGVGLQAAAQDMARSGDAQSYFEVVYIYIYIYIYVYIHVYVYIYIYIYIERERYDI